MVKQKKRVALTLEPDIARIYEDTARSMGIPSATFIAHMLCDAAPSIKQLGKSVEAAKNEPISGMGQLSRLAKKTSEKAAEYQVDIEEEIKRRT